MHKDLSVQWLPISTAPLNKVILTNEGTAIQYSSDGCVYGGPFAGHWYLCTMNEEIPSCSEDGKSISIVFPTEWMDVL